MIPMESKLAEGLREDRSDVGVSRAGGNTDIGSLVALAKAGARHEVVNVGRVKVRPPVMPTTFLA